MAKRSGYIVLIFLILWFPLPLLVAWTRIEKETFEQSLNFFLNLEVIAFTFSTLAATSNPVIYGLAIKTFRNASQRLFGKYLNRRR